MLGRAAAPGAPATDIGVCTYACIDVDAKKQFADAMARIVVDIASSVVDNA